MCKGAFQNISFPERARFMLHFLVHKQKSWGKMEEPGTRCFQQAGPNTGKLHKLCAGKTFARILGSSASGAIVNVSTPPVLLHPRHAPPNLHSRDMPTQSPKHLMDQIQLKKKLPQTNQHASLMLRPHPACRVHTGCAAHMHSKTGAEL